MFVRRVHFLRKSELVLQRTSLATEMKKQDTVESATRVAAVSTDLRQNVTAEQQNFMRFAFAVYFGVSRSSLHVRGFASDCQCWLLVSLLVLSLQANHMLSLSDTFQVCIEPAAWFVQPNLPLLSYMVTCTSATAWLAFKRCTWSGTAC